LPRNSESWPKKAQRGVLQGHPSASRIIVSQDAGLHGGLRKHRRDGLREPLEPGDRATSQGARVKPDAILYAFDLLELDGRDLGQDPL
jgi:hypothetical protein